MTQEHKEKKRSNGVSRVPLSEIAEIVSGFGFPKELQGKLQGDLPFFKVGDISRAWNQGQRLLTQAEHYISQKEAAHIRAKAFPRGTLVFAKIGEAIKLNRRAILGQPSIVDNNVMGLIPRQGLVDTLYLYYYMLTVKLGDISQATTVPSVRKSDVADIGFPLVAVEAQKAIVAEIEKQFSRLDEAVVSLKRTKANLKRYKASVLKAAVEGKLTEDWRKQHPDVEPASKLLERILAERRAKWSGKGNYWEPCRPDIRGLPTLPAGWTWARLDTVAALKGGITVDKNRKSSTAKAVPYLRVANVQRGYLDLSEVKEIDAPEGEIRDLRLVRGDILFTEGGDRDKLGRGWIWEGQLPECIHQNHIFRARLYSNALSPKLVSWWGNSFGQTYFVREGKQTTNLASINITKLGAFPIPLPPHEEQEQIVAEAERRLSVIDELEATVEANLTRADRLRQSVLQSAFSGRITSSTYAMHYKG